jgi:hypothetical protein
MSADEEIIDNLLGIEKPLPPAVAGNRLKRADAKFRAPERLKELAPEHLLLAQYLVFGISSPVRARQMQVGVDIPLSLKDAALAARVRVRRARMLATDPLFRAELARQLRGFRESLAPEATRIIYAIAEDPAENTAADRTVRLKAATALLGESGGGSNAAVQINIDNRTQQLTAGVVVRIPARDAAPALPPAPIKTIEHAQPHPEADRFREQPSVVTGSK